MQEPTTDVLIVGAGPTGLTLAIQLARFGIPCRIIDTAPAPTDKSKAIAIHARTLECFAAMGITNRLIADGIRARGFDFFANGAPLGHACLTTDLDTPYPFVLLLPQSETERFLIALLADLGINVERDVTLTGFVQDASGVTATLAYSGTHEERTTRCRWLVGCDGAHSTVRHALNLPFAGSAYEHTYWLADLHVHWALAHDEVHAFLGRQGFLFAFPIPETDRYRLIAQWDEPGQGPTADPTLAEMQHLMDRLGPAGTTLSDPIWLTAFRLHHRKVTRYQEGRIFVAGDAAHIHSPAGGQGMNTGIQDADNLAWKLALVAKRNANPALLASYDAERNAVGVQVLRQTDLMFRALMVQSSAMRAIRNRLLSLLVSRRALVRHMQRIVSELDIHYRKSPIVAEVGVRGGLHAGIRAPDVPLVTADGAMTCLWSLFPTDRLPQHTLLLLSGRKPSPVDTARLAAIRHMIERDFPDTVAIRLIVAGRGGEMDASWHGMRFDDPDLAAHKRYGVKKPALFLIRPDGYIGFRNQPANGDALRAYLGRIFNMAAH